MGRIIDLSGTVALSSLESASVPRSTKSHDECRVSSTFNGDGVSTSDDPDVERL